MDFVQQLKASVDIVRVVQDYVRLTKRGARYVGLCPFHNEKNPSFTVTPALQFFYCHGCHAGGDVLSFVMQIEHLSFFEARNTLAERNGIPLPKRSEYADEDTRLRAAVYQMHEIAQGEFENQLRSPQGAEARAYLEKRGVSPESVAQFGIGYSGRSLLRTLESHKFAQDYLASSGLVVRRDNGSFYDLFRNRLMFPIHNETGKVIGFGGRALDPEEKAKYINSPETPIYRKKTVLYNLHRAREAARKSGRLILVEGYMDVVGVYATGLTEVIATCGTALTREQVQVMKRHAPLVTVNFDPDAAGSNAAEKSIQLLLAESMRISMVQLEGGLDPDEYCRQHGGEAYARCVEKAKTYFYWLADRARAKFDMRTAEGRVDVFNFLRPAVQSLTDKLERAAVVNDLASYLNVPSGLVIENFRKLAGDKRDASTQEIQPRLPESDRLLLAVLLSDPESHEALIPALRELSVLNLSPAARIYAALFALADSGEPVHLANLHERLEEPDRKLLSASLLSSHANEHAVTLESALACLTTLKRRDGEQRTADLKARIREAERSGNLQEAMSLYKSLSRLA
ncbi:MAG: DNA primase [Acidobacteriota bacterium]|nr:DNA primase [Acidobacteriota bacterium]